MRCPHCDAAERLNGENAPDWATGAFGAGGVIGNLMSVPGHASTTSIIPLMWCVWWCTGSVIHVMLRCMRCPEKYLSYSSLTKLRLSISITCIPPPNNERTFRSLRV